LRQLGRYDLVAQIGEGGMAEVHLARQRGPRSFEKLVVVKTVRQSLASRPELAAMLLEEARIAALLKHPNVVDIYDLGEENGTYFIAMEYLEGESLAAILKTSRLGRRLDPFSTARIIADCAAGLDAAHELRSIGGDALELVHQDVTPGNVIVLYSGQVKLVDFGVAKIRTSTDDGLVKGKTGYLAPELLDGAPADRRSDIWSLGVVLWEALTLRRLFYGKTEEEAIAKIRAAEVPPPSAMVGSVPRELDEIVFTALARDPARRYPTAHLFQEELLQILRHASWSGGTEPIARFMRTVFGDRITARRQLLKEVANGKRARATTLERIQAIRDEAASPAGDGVVVGAHGSGARRVHRPSASLPLRAPSEEDVIVRLDDVEPGEATSPPPIATAEGSSIEPVSLADLEPPTPSVPVARTVRLRRVTTVAIAIGAAVGAIGAAIALNLGKAPAAGPDAGAIVSARSSEHAQMVRTATGDAGVAELAADAGAEPAIDVDVAAPDDGSEEDEPDRPGSSRRKHRERPHDRARARDRDRDHDHDRDEKPVIPAPPASGTAKTLYREGLQKFVGGDTSGALKLFDQARAKDSGYAPVYRGLGMAYERQGDRSRARRAFETYLRLAPDAADATQIRARLDNLR